MVALRRFMVVLLVLSLCGLAGGPLGARTPIVSIATQVQAPGRPYSGDCSQALPTAERLKKGLAVHEDAMRRAKAVIAAAGQNGSSLPSTAASVDSAKSVIMELMKEQKALRDRIEKLPLAAAQSESRTRILKSFDRIGDGSSMVDVLLAGGKYKQAMDEVNNMRQLVDATTTYLMDSGVGDMLASAAGEAFLTRALGASLAGPMGVLAMQVTALGIEVAAAEIQADIEAKDVRQAQDTYDAINYQYGAMQDRIKFLVENCGPAPDSEQKAKPETKPEPRGAKAKKAAPDGAEQAQKSSNTGKIVGVAAAAGGGAIALGYAAKLASQMSEEAGGGGCDPSKAPISQINYYCFGSTRNATQCNQYIAQYDSFCKSCGYSRFDVNQGGCR